MTKIRSLEDLARVREAAAAERQRRAELGQVDVIVSLGTCGIAAGALEVLAAVRRVIEQDGLQNVSVIEGGCIGLCRHEPILEVIRGSSPRVTYGQVTPEMARQIMRSHVVEGRVLEAFVIESIPYPSV